MPRWLFDAYSGLQDAYQEQFLLESETEAHRHCFERTLAAIQDDPIVDDYVTVGERRWYVVRTGGYSDGPHSVPEYLCVYTADEPEEGLDGIIRPLLVCKATALGAEDGHEREVVRLIERTLARVARHQYH